MPRGVPPGEGGPAELPRRGRDWDSREVEDEDDLEAFIASENRKAKRKES